MGILGKIKEEFETILFDSIKENLKQAHNTRKIKDDIKAYANQQFDSIYETADLKNEIDFQGLMQYIENSLLDEVKYYLFVHDVEQAEQYKSMILTKAQEYARANTPNKKESVARFIETTLQIARNYYIDRLDGEHQIFLNLTAQEIVKSIGQDLKRLEEGIEQIPQKVVDRLSEKESFNHLTIGKFLTKAPPVVDDTFLYRDATVNELLEKINTEKHLLLVNGFGGIGKTIVARALFHKLKKACKYIAWIAYEGCLKDSILSSFLLYDQAKEGRFESIMAFLREHSEDTILFIDNVTNDTASDPLLKEIAGIDLATILTSRINRIQPYRPYLIDFLSPEECVELFYIYASLEYPFDPKRKKKTIVEKMVELVAYHTLSIELLAKSIIPGMDLEAYYYKLKEIGFGFPEIQVSTSHTDVMQTIPKHLKKLFDLASLELEQVYILRNFACMPSMEIPGEVTEWINCDRNAIFKLARLGWLSKSETGYSMHPIIKETILLDPIPDETTESFLTYLSEESYIKQTETYIGISKKLEIAESILSYTILKETVLFASVYNNLAGSYKLQGDYEKAMEFYQKALAIREQVLGKQHPDTVATYDNLAGVYEKQGDYEKAMKFDQKALAIREQVLGKQHPDTATIYNNLGEVYKAQGEYEKAMEFYQKALAIEERVLGSQHSDTAITYNNLGNVYKVQGDYEKAMEFYQKAIKISEQVLGEQHPNTVIIYNNLGGVYMDQGDYEKAIEFYQKAMEISEQVLGKQHPDTATIYNNLGGVYVTQGDYEKAIEFYQKVLEIREQVLGKQHPDTAIIYDNLGGVYENQGDYEKAMEFYQKALAIEERVLGSQHLDTAITYNNLAGVYMDQGDYEKAIEFYQKAMEISEQVLGEQHPNTAITYNNLGNVYKVQGDYEKAMEFYQKAIKISEQVLGEQHPNTVSTYNNLGGVYQAQGDYEKAMEFYQKAMEIKEQVLGE